MPDIQEIESLGATFSRLPEKLTLWNLVYILVIIVAAMVVSRIVLALVNRALGKSKLDPTLIRIIRTVVKLVVGVVCVLLICETLGVEITSLIALFSVIGLALSLAAQGVLANLAGGITILGARPFRVGDFVEMDGVKGTVKEVALMYTKLDTTDNKLVYLPNKIVSEAKVLNYSKEPTRRIEITFSASYESPIPQVKAAVLESLGANPLTLAEPEPVVGVARYGASAIEYNLWVWCRGEDYWPAFYSVTEGVKQALDAAGLEMTYDHLNVHMLER